MFLVEFDIFQAHTPYNSLSREIFRLTVLDPGTYIRESRARRIHYCYHRQSKALYTIVCIRADLRFPVPMVTREALPGELLLLNWSLVSTSSRENTFVSAICT